jgi:tRNA 2-selenouridine synthase
MELLDLLRRQTPLIDVRSPSEFARGAFPGAVNLPILEDAERAAVGRAYREQGQAAAVALGHQLVRGEQKRKRVEAWQAFLRTHGDAWLYCWRGGMRSEIAARWLAETGCTVQRVPGGFKALRQACLGVLESPPDQRWWLLSGRTGSGKTRLLQEFSCSLDLEAHAAHRGSAFGATAQQQPTPVDFEHRLVAELLTKTGADLLLEDESRTIGRAALPAAWFSRMQSAPCLVLEIPLAQRVANVREEYVDAPLRAGAAPDALRARYLDALGRIRRRLGGLRHDRIHAEIEAAFSGGGHEGWITSLLREYYDPMYDYQLARKTERIRLRGDAQAVRDFVATWPGESARQTALRAPAPARFNVP